MSWCGGGGARGAGRGGRGADGGEGGAGGPRSAAAAAARSSQGGDCPGLAFVGRRGDGADTSVGVGDPDRVGLNPFEMGRVGSGGETN